MALGAAMSSVMGPSGWTRRPRPMSIVTAPVLSPRYTSTSAAPPRIRSTATTAHATIAHHPSGLIRSDPTIGHHDDTGHGRAGPCGAERGWAAERPTDFYGAARTRLGR